MRIVHHYGEAEWLNWRRGGVSASDAPVIAGEITQPSLFQLWLDKCGQGTPVEASVAMRFGKAMEPAIAAMYTDLTGDPIRSTQICGEAEGTPYPMRATLDAITTGGKILEFKAVSVGGARFWPEDGDADNLPPRVLYQVQHQMRVAEKDRCTVVAAIPLELRLYEVRRDDELIESLMALEAEFWDHVLVRVPPRYEDGDAEMALRHLGVVQSTVNLGMDSQDWVESYENACQTIKELESEKKRMRDRIISAMNGNRYGSLPDGRMVHCNVIHVAERTQTVKAHSQVRLTIKQQKE